MYILFICILISCYCFCADTDEKASFVNALYVFENASDNMIMRQLTVIDRMFRTHEQIPSNINVINKSSRHCLLRCALEHGMVRFFEEGCQKKCANMHAHENGSGIKTTLFFHWLIRTQPWYLIKQALDAGADPKKTDGLKQDAFVAASDRAHISALLQSYVDHVQQHDPVVEQPQFMKHSRSQSYDDLQCKLLK